MARDRRRSRQFFLDSQRPFSHRRCYSNRISSPRLFDYFRVTCASHKSRTLLRHYSAIRGFYKTVSGHSNQCRLVLSIGSPIAEFYSGKLQTICILNHSTAGVAHRDGIRMTWDCALPFVFSSVIHGSRSGQGGIGSVAGRLRGGSSISFACSSPISLTGSFPTFPEDTSQDLAFRNDAIGFHVRVLGRSDDDD